MAYRVGIVGQKGRLGVALQQWFEPVDCDVTDPESVRAGTDGYDVIINCAAKTNLDECERDIDACFAVNMHGAVNLRNQFKGWLLQVSTAYVFADEEMVAHKPESVDYNPLCNYAAAKVGAEIYLSTLMENTTILRTNGIFGSPVKTDGLQMFMKRQSDGTAPKNLHGQSIHVDSLAESIKYIVEKEIGKGEVLHLVHHASYMSRLSLYLRLYNMMSKGDDKEKEYTIHGFEWEAVGGIADRPRHCCLDMDSTLKYKIPVGTLVDGLRRMVNA